LFIVLLGVRLLTLAIPCETDILLGERWGEPLFSSVQLPELCQHATCGLLCWVKC